MHTVRQIIFFLLALLLMQVQTSSAGEQDRGLLWKAEKDGRTIYLLGSIHLATADFYPLRAAIEKAYASSEALVVEADIIAAQGDMALQQRIMAESMYGPGESLRDHLSPVTYQKLQQWLQKRKLPEQLFIRQRPAIAMITLSLMEMQARGLNPNLGIDRHFLQQARDKGKPVLELESVLGQLQLLNSLDKPDLFLRQTLEQLAEIDTFIPQMTGAWKAGDAERLHKLVIADGLDEHPEFLPLYETLFFKRNKTMADKLLHFSAQHSELFAVVGAGHLVGERSVIDLLQQRGFTVRQI